MDLKLAEPLATARQMQQLDRETMKELQIDSKELMYRAAYAIFRLILEEHMLKGKEKVLILCGVGNNGGDGYVLAHLLSAYLEVMICMPKGDPKTEDSIYYYQQCKKNARIKYTKSSKDLGDLDESWLIIDAVYGTGFRGELGEEEQVEFAFCNRQKAFRISVDIPSGLHCDTGTRAQQAFESDLCISFEFKKPALVSYPGKGCSKELRIVSIGFPDKVRRELKPETYYLNQGILEYFERGRPDNTHKMTYGKVLSVCGSEYMTGAAYFAAMGALRSGAGLVEVAASKSVLKILQTNLREPIFGAYDSTQEFKEVYPDLGQYQVVLHGCGSGLDQEELLEYLIRNTQHCLILDADALNLLAKRKELLYLAKAEVVLTPHPGEMARLLETTSAKIQENRIESAKLFAIQYQCTVVLKGAATVIASKDGIIAINSSGNAGLAKAGSGDVLAGMIAGYCASEGLTFESICGAVYAHGAKGDRLARKKGQREMLPSDMLL